MACGRKEVARRCPSGIEVPRLLNLREEETNGSLLGELALSSQALLCLLGDWDLLICQWIRSPEWVAQCNVCKYDKPLQYYSFSFGKPLRQEMVTDPWYVNDGNAEISIWVNSYIFQPWWKSQCSHSNSYMKASQCYELTIALIYYCLSSCFQSHRDGMDLLSMH